MNKRIRRIVQAVFVESIKIIEHHKDIFDVLLYKYYYKEVINMVSKFTDVMVSENSGKEKVERVYLKAKTDFPINVPKEYRITGAHSARQLFQGGQPQCRSYDGKVGRSRETEWKVEIDCKECPKAKEKDLSKKCQYKFVFEFEHPEAGKIYELTAGYSAQIAFSEYLKGLIAEGLDADQVTTLITRIENPDGPGTTYTFAKGKVLEVKGITDTEQKAVDAVKQKIKTDYGGSMEADKVASVLATLSSYGISESRASEIANMIAVDGMVLA